MESLLAGYHSHSWVNFSGRLYVINVDPFAGLYLCPSQQRSRMLALIELTRLAGHPCKLFVSRKRFATFLRKFMIKRNEEKLARPGELGCRHGDPSTRDKFSLYKQGVSLVKEKENGGNTPASGGDHSNYRNSCLLNHSCIISLLYIWFGFFIGTSPYFLCPPNDRVLTGGWALINKITIVRHLGYWICWRKFYKFSVDGEALEVSDSKHNHSRFLGNLRVTFEQLWTRFGWWDYIKNKRLCWLV